MIQHRKLTNSRNKPNTRTSNKTTNNHYRQRSGRSFQDTTNGKGHAANNNGPTTADPIGYVTSDDGTEECTTGEDTGQERLLPSWDDEGVLLSWGGVWTRVL